MILGASVPGPGHLGAGLPCQDACGHARLDDGTLLLAVADGAGSASLAEVGAAVAVAGALAALQTCGAAGSAVAADPAAPPDLSGVPPTPPGPDGVPAPPTLRLRTALYGARTAVEAAAQARGVALRELASTLLLCLWSAAGAAAAHIGDGAAVAWSEAEGLSLLSAPAAAEYVNETAFLTDPDWAEAVRLTARPGCTTGLVLMSDGCQRAALQHRRAADGTTVWEPFAPFLAPILRFAAAVADPAAGSAELAALLASAKLAAHSDDDKTLLVLYASGEAGQAEP